MYQSEYLLMTDGRLILSSVIGLETDLATLHPRFRQIKG
jgi:hypothetical protein